MDKIMEPGLYNMDCMEAMKQFPDGFFDLAIVDPPYGGGYKEDDATALRGGGHRTGRSGNGAGSGEYSTSITSKRPSGRRRRLERPARALRFRHFQKILCRASPALRGGGTDWQRKDRGRWGQRFDRYHISNPDRGNVVEEIPAGTTGAADIRHWDVAPPQEYFDELARVSKNQIIWGGNYFDLPPTRCFVVWDKGIAEKFSMAMCEYAWTSFNANAKLFHYLPQGKKGEERFHPTQKPVALYSWLLKLYAKRGMKILDTHAGSASSLVACHRAGIDAWGYEIDPEYYRMAMERLERECAQVGLYSLEAQQPGAGLDQVGIFDLMGG